MYVGFFPYYVFYYFIYNIYKYIDYFQSDFDRGLIKFYYPQFFCLTDLGNLKLALYTEKIITGHSKNLFIDSVIFNLDLNFPKNWVFFECSRFNDIDVLFVNKLYPPIIYT